MKILLKKIKILKFSAYYQVKFFSRSKIPLRRQKSHAYFIWNFLPLIFAKFRAQSISIFRNKYYRILFRKHINNMYNTAHFSEHKGLHCTLFRDNCHCKKTAMHFCPSSLAILLIDTEVLFITVYNILYYRQFNEKYSHDTTGR